MEHIKETLGSLSKEAAIPPPKIYEEPEKTREEKLEDLRVSLGVASLTNTFESFDRSIKGSLSSLRAFQALVTGKTSWQMLLCYGGTGNGKTHLLEAFVISLYKQRRRSHIETMPEMMGRIKMGMKQDARVSSDELISGYRIKEILLLDDVGMGGTASDWEWAQLEDIIARRYRDNLLTVLTSNLDLKQIQERSERIVSRFRDRSKARLVLNKAPDYRPEKK